MFHPVLHQMKKANNFFHHVIGLLTKKKNVASSVKFITILAMRID